MPKSRISDYSSAIADAICARLSIAESLRAIRADDAMPPRKTVYSWLKKHKEFREQYELACSFVANCVVDEILEISDDARNDWTERKYKQDSTMVFNPENVQCSRLRIQARQ